MMKVTAVLEPPDYLPSVGLAMEDEDNREQIVLLLHQILSPLYNLLTAVSLHGGGLALYASRQGSTP